MPPSLLLLAALLLVSTSTSSSSPSPCSTPLDCALNGACGADGACACSPGWTGADCSRLDLLPAPQSSGVHLDQTSSWGGSVAPLGSAAAASGEVHLFASVFKNCGLTSWTHNSYIAHFVSTTGLLGAFTQADTSLDVWTHNTVFVNVTGEGGGGGDAYLIFHIGDGKEGDGYLQPCTPSSGGNSSLDNVGLSQCGLLWFPCAAPPTCDDMPTIDGYECVTYACSGDDGWSWGRDGGAAVAAGLPVSVSGRGRGLRDDVDCGARIQDVMLKSCVGAEECAIEAAGACQATPGCASFAVSDFLDNYTFAMLFSAGEEGLRPNAQWNTYVAIGGNGTATAGGGHSSRRGASRDLPRTQKQPQQQQSSPSPPSPSSKYGAPYPATFPVSFSTSLSGPWTTIFANATAPTNGNNPAPYVARNGSIYVVFNDGDMTLFRSDSGYGGPYLRVTGGACGGGEDPAIWQDAGGNWHCLYHRSPFADPAHQAIGHAYSPDGFTWFTSPGAAATSVVNYTDGGGGGDVLTVTFGKRERPHLVFSAETGDPIAFISAVGINPACDPFVFDPATGLPAINATALALINAGAVPHCDAWTQYQRLDLNMLPGYFDRSWTLIQTLRGAA
jgi:hypothetical protein